MPSACRPRWLMRGKCPSDALNSTRKEETLNHNSLQVWMSSVFCVTTCSAAIKQAANMKTLYKNKAEPWGALFCLIRSSSVLQVSAPLWRSLSDTDQLWLVNSPGTTTVMKRKMAGHRPSTTAVQLRGLQKLLLFDFVVSTQKNVSLLLTLMNKVDVKSLFFFFNTFLEQ